MPRSFWLDVSLAEILEPDARHRRPEHAPLGFVLTGMEMEPRIERMLAEVEIRSRPSHE